MAPPIRTTVSGILHQTVLHKTIPTSPVRELDRIESPEGHRPALPRGLTAEERLRLLEYVDNDRASIAADTPHTWRRTYATVLDEELTSTDRAKVDLLGQPKFLKDTYVRIGELHLDAAVHLDIKLGGASVNY